MRCLFCLLATLLGVGWASAQDPIDKAADQIESVRRLLTKKEPVLAWNRYATKNFEVLSLDDPQGKYLCDNVEFVKTWIAWRWGLADVDFPARCKVMCVPSADLFGKLFVGKSPTWRADNAGYGVWVVTDGQQWNTRLPNLLTEVVLYNFELKYNSRLPAWCHRGMSILNGRLDDIHAAVANVRSLDTASLLGVTQEAYKGMSDADKASFDARAAVLALCLRKIYGSKGFVSVLEASLVNPAQCLGAVKTSPADADARFLGYLSSLLANKRNLSW